MSATYTPCAGTGQRGTEPKTITGAEGKFFRLNGKTYAACPACARRMVVAPRVLTVPRHKDVR
jgi:DNA-directed RNA polymerase subunit RPC12/RpoP